MSKIHMKRNSRETWCGRKLVGLALATRGATCKVCLKADAAEAARNS